MNTEKAGSVFLCVCTLIKITAILAFIFYALFVVIPEQNRLIKKLDAQKHELDREIEETKERIKKYDAYYKDTNQ